MNKPTTSTHTPPFTTLLGGLPAGTDVHRPMRWHAALASLEPHLRAHDPVRAEGVHLFRGWLRRKNPDLSLHELAQAWTDFVQLARRDLNTWTFLSVWDRFYLFPRLFQGPLLQRLGYWIGATLLVLVLAALLTPFALTFGAYLSHLADLLKLLIRPDLAP